MAVGDNGPGHASDAARRLADVPTPIAFCLPVTASDGLWEPRANRGCWAANLATQSQPYAC